MLSSSDRSGWLALENIGACTEGIFVFTQAQFNVWIQLEVCCSVWGICSSIANGSTNCVGDVIGFDIDVPLANSVEAGSDRIGPAVALASGRRKGLVFYVGSEGWGTTATVKSKNVMAVNSAKIWEDSTKHAVLDRTKPSTKEFCVGFGVKKKGDENGRRDSIGKILCALQ